MTRIKKYLNYLLYSKFQLFIKKKKFVIFDTINLDFLFKYINQSEVEIVYIRGEQFNIPIILKTFFKSGLNTKKYYENLINEIDPDFCITFSDNNKLFYELKLKKKIKKIAIQNAWRNPQDDDIFNHKKESGLRLYSDYLFVFNEFIGKEYLKAIESKIIAIGSFKSNLNKIKETKQKYDLLYISSYNDKNKVISNTEMKVSTYHKNQPSLLKQINSYAKNYNQNLFVYGKKQEPIEIVNEEKYFRNHLFKNFSYLKNNRLKSLEIIDGANIIITINSTLGYEALARGKKVIFFNILPNSKTSKFTKFGWPFDFEDEGLFWTNKFDNKNVVKIIDRVQELSSDEWQRQISQISRSLLNKDHGNYKFRQIIDY